MPIKRVDAPRFTVASSAGGRTVDGVRLRYAVLDHQDCQGGKGQRRVSWHKTFKQAQKAAKRLNAQEATDVPRA